MNKISKELFDRVIKRNEEVEKKLFDELLKQLVASKSIKLLIKKFVEKKADKILGKIENGEI